MDQIDVGKLTVAPFDFDSIIEVRMEKALNEHSTLYVHGIVKEEDNINPVLDMTEGTPIRFENDGHVYFSGVLTSIEIKCEGSQYHLHAFASSNTILLDVVKHKRSFQDNKMTYKAIVEHVIQEEGGVVEYHADEMKVENIILQYDETDWEFAKRLASHTQDVLIPIVSEDRPAFHFSVPEREAESREVSEFTISKNFKAYRNMVKQEKPLTAEDVTFYAVTLGDYVCELGEAFNLNGKDLHVHGLTLSLVDSALTVTYVLAGKNALSAPKSFNHGITGLTIRGIVLSVEGDRVKLHLDTDIKEDEPTAHLFKYATGYDAENCTGWYVMPEAGDCVHLLFPTEDERQAYAACSVRMEDTARTADHKVKYWRTADGKEIKMDEKEILLTAHDGGAIGSEITYVRMHEDRGVDIITPRPLRIQTQSTMNIESQGDMSIVCRGNLHIQGDASITLVNADNIMKYVPEEGITVSTEDEMKLISGGDAAVSSEAGLMLISGEGMSLDCGGEMEGHAATSIELSGAGSSVTIDAGEINGKAPDVYWN